MEGGLMSAMTLGGSSSGGWQPPSLDPEPTGPPPGGQWPDTTGNPLSADSAGPPNRGHSGVQLALAAAEAINIQIDTTLDPNGFDLSDGVASRYDAMVAQQMMAKKIREKTMMSEKTETSQGAAKNIAIGCFVMMVVFGCVAAYLFGVDPYEGMDDDSDCPANLTVVRHVCTVKDSSVSNDVAACLAVTDVSSGTACSSVPAAESYAGGDQNAKACRYRSFTECRRGETVGLEAQSTQGADSTPVSTGPSSASESWNFLGGASMPDAESQYTAAVPWPGARSGSTTWREGDSVFMLGGIGCGEVADGSCGDQGMDVGPEQTRTSIGLSADYLNDLWEYSNSRWTFGGGSQRAGGEADGGYDAPAVDATDPPWPGKRAMAATWNSEYGLLVFGGQTCVACTDQNNRKKEAVNDMWLGMPDNSFTEWAWIPPLLDGLSPSHRTNVVGLGGRGIYSSSGPCTWPGARAGTAVWKHPADSMNKGYMFGGHGYGASSYSSRAGSRNMEYLNELWGVAFATQEWLMQGSYNSNHRSYEHPGTGDWPSIRAQPSVWTTLERHKTYIFGGLTTTSGAATLGDLWRFDAASRDAPFSLLSGDVAPNGGPSFCGHPPCTSPGIHPGSRYGAAAWAQKDGRLWLHGGRGLSSADGNGRCSSNCAYLSDYWSADSRDGSWKWEGGSQRDGTGGVYSRGGGVDGLEYPGSRMMAGGWTDPTGDIAYLFGGLGYSTRSAGGAFLCFVILFTPSWRRFSSLSDSVEFAAAVRAGNLNDLWSFNMTS